MADAPRDGWSDEHDELAADAGYESWAAWVEDIESDLPHDICGARSKKDAPCSRPYVYGNPKGRCKFHGGGSPVEAVDREKTGRYGKRLQDAAARVYQSERDDPASLGNRDEIALATVRVGELLDRLEQIEPDGDGDRDAIWERIDEWLARRSDLVDAERKLLEARHRAVPTDRVRAIVNYIGQSALRAVERNVDDPGDRDETLREIRAALDRLRRGAVGPGGGSDPAPEPSGRAIESGG